MAGGKEFAGDLIDIAAEDVDVGVFLVGVIGEGFHDSVFHALEGLE